MTREQILDEAKSIVCKDRNAQYGEPEDNFKVIAGLWTQYAENYIKNGPILPEDVAFMMLLFKIGRLITGGFKHDTLVDIVGYAACAEELMTNEIKNEQR